ncbi:hypothetical protein SBADM41S_04164 [Streptomyces badius]
MPTDQRAAAGAVGVRRVRFDGPVAQDHDGPRTAGQGEGAERHHGRTVGQRVRQGDRAAVGVPRRRSGPRRRGRPCRARWRCGGPSGRGPLPSMPKGVVCRTGLEGQHLAVLGEQPGSVQHPRSGGRRGGTLAVVPLSGALAALAISAGSPARTARWGGRVVSPASGPCRRWRGRRRAAARGVRRLRRRACPGRAGPPRGHRGRCGCRCGRSACRRRPGRWCRPGGSRPRPAGSPRGPRRRGRRRRGPASGREGPSSPWPPCSLRCSS